MSIKLTWYGHSCFSIKAGDCTVVFDPFTGVEGYSDPVIEADAVLCSHGHFDHCYTDAVKEAHAGQGVQILCSGREFEETGTEINFGPFRFVRVMIPHDDRKGELRGLNEATVIYVDGLKLCHFGDTGTMPTVPDFEYLKNLDVAMVPVGGTYTITAEQAYTLMKLLAPKVVIPMHYKTSDYGFGVLQHVDEFIHLRCGAYYEEGNSAEIDRAYVDSADNRTLIFNYTK